MPFSLRFYPAHAPDGRNRASAPPGGLVRSDFKCAPIIWSLALSVRVENFTLHGSRPTRTSAQCGREEPYPPLASYYATAHIVYSPVPPSPGEAYSPRTTAQKEYRRRASLREAPQQNERTAHYCELAVCRRGSFDFSSIGLHRRLGYGAGTYLRNTLDEATDVRMTPGVVSLPALAFAPYATYLRCVVRPCIQ